MKVDMRRKEPCKELKMGDITSLHKLRRIFLLRGKWKEANELEKVITDSLIKYAVHVEQVKWFELETAPSRLRDLYQKYGIAERMRKFEEKLDK